MSKFNRTTTQAAVSSPVKSEATPSGHTYEGAPGYARDAKSELFLLAVANMVGEQTFYEKAGERDDRYRQLVRQCTVEDPVWTFQLLRWLRSEGNMRSASLVGAAEFVRASLDANNAPFAAYEIPGLNDDRALNRAVVDAVLQRPDEPGEMLAYWTSTYGRKIPQPVKRGIADAVRRLYNERSLLKYDTGSKGFRFADVIDMVHPSPAAGKPWQGDLFKHALDRRHNRDEPIPESLQMLFHRAALMEQPVETRRGTLLSPNGPDVLARAGMTWEALAGWLQGPMDAKAWDAVIPSMGYMALVRNLRNFDQAGVSDEVAQQVAAKLSDPEQVVKSRMFPFRFLSAHRAAPSLRWAWPLEQALGHSLQNVPALPGWSLVLVDRSPSMWGQNMSERSDMSWADGAAVFGAAVALRAERADLVEFGSANKPVPFQRAESVLKLVERFGRGDGTDIPRAVRDNLKPHHTRIIIVTDEQTRPGWLPSNVYGYRGHYPGAMPETRIDDLVPAGVPLYMWNFAGYKHGAAPSGTTNRHTFGGLSDAAFRMVPLLEAGRNAAWPWA